MRIFGRKRKPQRAAGTAVPEQIDPWLRMPGESRIELVRGTASETWEDYRIFDALAIAALMVNSPVRWSYMVMRALGEHGPRCARYLTAARSVSDELAPLSVLSSQFVLAWVARKLLTDRVDEPEFRAAFLLALADEIPPLSRIAAAAVMELPPGHPQRDEARVTAGLTSMMRTAVAEAGEPNADWGALAGTFLTAVAGLVEYRLYPEARLDQVIAAALRLMRAPHLRDKAVARKDIAGHRLLQAKEARDRGETEVSERLAAEAARLFDELAKADTDPVRRAALAVLSAHATGDGAAMSQACTQLAGAPDASARNLATAVLGRQAHESEDDQQALDLLVPTLEDTEGRYLAAVLERDIGLAAQSFADAVRHVAASYARLGRFGAAIAVLERGKSLRLRYRAWLRSGPQGDALRNLEAKIDAAQRGLAPEDRFSPSLSGLLEGWRTARAAAGDACLLRPGVREIAAALAEDEVAVVLGDTPAGLVLTAIRAGDQEEPSFATLLPPEHLRGIGMAMMDRERGWWIYRGFGPGFAAPHDALATFLDAAERYLGRDLAAALAKWDVERVTVIPHLLLHLVPYWALPSLARYRVMTVPSAAHLVASRGDVAPMAEQALVVGNPTGDLDVAAAEAAHIAELLEAAGYGVALRRGPEATQRELELRAVGCGLVHFSGHGLSDLEVPLRSALEVHAEADSDLLTRLATDAEWQPVHRWVIDHWVRSSERRARISEYGWLDYRLFPSSGVSQLHLEHGPRSTLLGRFAPTDDDGFGEPLRIAELWSAGDIIVERTLASCRLAVLSACDTSAGWEHPFIDEGGGLPAALELAGVTTVVTPLWPVSEELAAVFAAIFYKYLLDASGPFDVLAAVDRVRHRLRTMTGAEAADILTELRSTTSDVLELLHLDSAIEAVRVQQHPFGNPFDWAAFSMSGAPIIYLPGDRGALSLPPLPDRRFELPPAAPVQPRTVVDVFSLADSAVMVAEASAEPVLARLAAEKLVDRGLAYKRLGRNDEALRDFRRAAELDPRNVASRIELIVMTAIEDPNEALRQSEEVIAIDGSDLEAQLIRACALMDLDQLDSAAEQLDRLLGHDPENAVVLKERSSVRRRRGDLEGALTDINTALERLPERWDWYQLRADLHRDRGDPDLAKADVRRAAFLAPDESGADSFV